MLERRFGGPATCWDDYLRLFHGVSGDLWSKTAPGNIAAAIPQARIITILRNPVERAFSQYQQAIGAGLVRYSFREHIIRRNREHQGNAFCVHYPFLELGLYGEQVKRYATVFPPENARIHLYEDYRDEPAVVIRDLLRFLEVGETFRPDTSCRCLEAQPLRSVTTVHLLKKCGIWQAAKRWKPPRFELWA